MSEKKSVGTVLFNGIIPENPTFRLVLGTCPTLAVTTSALNGLGMGAAATFVLVCSNIAISLLRKFIPDQVRIPAFIVVICTFVTMVQLLMKAFLPALDESLGIFIPLIVVLIRLFGSYPEGVTYAILLMNIASPLLDRFLPQKIYGYQKKEVKQA